MVPNRPLPTYAMMRVQENDVMFTKVSQAIIAILSISTSAIAEPMIRLVDLVENRPAPQASVDASVVDDADNGWTWSRMAAYADVDLVKGTGHAGGPGAYGIFTFDGTGVDVYAMRASTVAVDGRPHKVGKLKISIDGHLKAEVALSGSGSASTVDVYGVSGLPSKIHVLEVEPEGGWAVVDYIKVNAAASALDVGKGNGSTADPSVLFSSKITPLSAVSSVEARNNVVGFNDNIGPELQIGDLPADWGFAPIHAHSGSSAIRYSGSSTGARAFCYMYAYAVKIPVAANTWLSYWILPQQDNGRYIAVDLHCTDGTTLSQTAAVDEGGVAVAPASGHGGAIPLYSWTSVRCHIGEWLAGKTIDKIWIGYARQGGSVGGQYRGYVDDLLILNDKR